MGRQGGEAVSALLERLAAQVGSQRVRVWVKNATSIRIEDGFVRVGVPNSFVGQWLETHLAEAIGRAASEITGRSMRVAFVLEPGLCAQLRKRQLESQAEYLARAANGGGRRGGPRGNGVVPRRLRGRFEDFVVGACNRLAYEAARRVAEQPTPEFRTLFLFGSSGLGKTHLLQAIWNAVRERGGRACEYLSGEEFTNEFVQALRHRTVDRFRARYRHLDLLLIDDVHFLASKKATQEEFLHTFNAIDAEGRQVVLTCDVHPRMIGHIPARLASRFLAGMVVRLERPDYETRCRVLARRAAERGLDVGEEVIAVVAEHLRTNFREIEGAVLKMVQWQRAMGESITVDVARRLVQEDAVRVEPLVHLSDIEAAVGARFGVTPPQMHSARRSRTIALARNLVMYFARQHTRLSYPEIGRFMGKDHTTVLHACRRIQSLLAADAEVRWDGPAGREQASARRLVEELEVQILEGLGGQRG